MKELICKSCGGPREVGRRLCRKCNNDRLCEYNVAHEKGRYTWSNKCLACEKVFDAWRKEQALCPECFAFRKSLAAETRTRDNDYVRDSRGVPHHRSFVEKELNISLTTDEVIHHYNDNHHDDSPSNLIVESRSNHTKLHHFLDMQKTILAKKLGAGIDEAWPTAVVNLTDIWFNDNGLTPHFVGKHPFEL